MTAGAPSGRPAPRLAIASAIVAAWGMAPAPWMPGWSARARDVLRDDGRNAADYDKMERGYYERLLDHDRPRPPASAPADFGPLTVPVADVREYVLKPGLATTHRGACWNTNALGMRDRPYQASKPPGTFRIALVGDSIGSGWGVADGRGFEPTWEKALDERSRSHHGPAVEVCNLAVPGHAPGQRWEHASREAWVLTPDLVVFQGTAADLGWDERKLRSLLPRGLGWDALGYQQALTEAGIATGGDEASYKLALRPRRELILAGVYRRAVEDCRTHGVRCAWLLLPRVGKAVDPADRSRLVGLARAAGFSAVIDLSDAFDGLDPRDLAIGPDDFHPNGLGHDRLARLLIVAWEASGIMDHATPGDEPR